MSNKNLNELYNNILEETEVKMSEQTKVPPSLKRKQRIRKYGQAYYLHVPMSATEIFNYKDKIFEATYRENEIVFRAVEN